MRKIINSVPSEQTGHRTYCPALSDGALILPREVKNPRVVPGDDHRHWVQLSRPVTLCERFIKTSLPGKRLRVPLMSRRVVGIELDRPAEFFLRCPPIIVIVLSD